MRVAVLGGGGFIGSAIVDRLLADGHAIRVFERPRIEAYRTFAPGEDVEWLTGDLANVADVTRAVSGVDALMHLVGATLPADSNRDMIYDVESNVVTTLRVLGVMASEGVRRIVFISSGGTVYGNPVRLPIDESHPTDPRVSYGITKLAIEKYLLLHKHLHGMTVRILRVSNPFGERQRVETAQGAVAAFLRRALRNEPLEIWGDGSVTRDYLHVSDVADAFARALVYEGDESVFNIGSGVGTSLNDLIAMLERVVGRPLERRYAPGRAFDVPRSILDNARARRELGWSPRVSMEDGLVRTAAWIREQQSR